MNKQELLQELRGLGTGLGSAGAKMSKSMGAPGLDIKPSNSARTPPSQTPAGQVDPAAQTQPEEVEGPETETIIPKPEPIKLDKLGMPDKDKLRGHKVKYDGRDYILTWDELFQVYKVVDPETKIVKTRVKPSMVSTIDYVLKDSIDDAIKALVAGEPLRETIDELVEVNWRDTAKKVGKFLWKHKGKIATGIGLGALGVYAHKSKKKAQEKAEQERIEKMTPAERGKHNVEKVIRDQERDYDPETGKHSLLTRAEKEQLSPSQRLKMKYSEQPLTMFDDIAVALRQSFSKEKIKRMTRAEARRKAKKWIKSSAKVLLKIPFSIPFVGPILEAALDDASDAMVDNLMDTMFGTDEEIKSEKEAEEKAKELADKNISKDEKDAASKMEAAFNKSIDKAMPKTGPTERTQISYSPRQQRILEILKSYCDRDPRVGCWVMSGIKLNMPIKTLANDLNYRAVGSQPWTTNDLAAVFYLRLGLHPQGYEKLRTEFHTDVVKKND